MTSLVLLAWGVLLATLGPSLLADRPWALRAPRLAVTAWLALVASVVTAVLGAGLLVAVPPTALTEGVHGLVSACAQALGGQSGTARVLSALALVATAALAARLVVAIAATVLAAHRWRVRHIDGLTLAARRGPAHDCLLVDHDAPAVYCLPGRGGHIVLTTAALAALSADELACVLAHERAHLRGRHHLLVAFAAGFRRAFPGLPLAGALDVEVRRLVEHLADDRAAAGSERQRLATALVGLVDARPQAALGAATVAVERVHRLVSPAMPLPRRQQALGTVVLVALVAAPLALASPTLLTMLGAGCATS